MAAVQSSLFPLLEQETKTCRRCHEIKPRGKFPKIGRICNKCCASRPKVKARRHARYKEWKARDPEGVRRCQREDAAKRYAKDPTKHKAQSVAARKRHIESTRARNRAYYARDPERFRKQCRDYQKRNPGKFTELRHKRRARLKAAEGSWTTKEWISLCAQYDNRCLWCRQLAPLSVDHIVPISMGGTNDISNIQPLCYSCNSRKGIHIMDFRSSIQ